MCYITAYFIMLLQVQSSGNDGVQAVAWEAIALVQDGTGRAYIYIDGAQDVCTLMRIQQSERQVCTFIIYICMSYVPVCC
jgi:hypothetical protein